MAGLIACVYAGLAWWVWVFTNRVVLVHAVGVGEYVRKDRERRWGDLLIHSQWANRRKVLAGEDFGSKVG